MELKTIYEDNDVLVTDKPAGIVVFPPVFVKATADKEEKTLIDYLLEKHSDLKNTGEKPRYGIVHRLDKDTSGILLIAKNNKTLELLQKQFKKREVKKKYLALVIGNLKSNEGKIETLIGRNPKDGKKQKVYLPYEPKTEGKREAITEYKVIERFLDKNGENFTLLEITPKTGRKHQIRTHLAYIGHPIVGDKSYGFKNQSCPKELNRHFLHASYLKIKLVTGETKEFKSKLLEDLKKVLYKYGYQNRNL